MPSQTSVSNDPLLRYALFSAASAVVMAAIVRAGIISTSSGVFILALVLLRGRLWMQLASMAVIMTVLVALRQTDWGGALAMLVIFLAQRLLIRLFESPAPPENGEETASRPRET